MKFREVKYAKQFVARGLEIHAIKPEQVEEVMECEIDLGINPDPESPYPGYVLVWSESGLAGDMMRAIYMHDLERKATDSPTPCSSCEALKARVKELEEDVKNNNTLVQKAFDYAWSNCDGTISGFHRERSIFMQAHGIETRCDV